MMRLPSLDLATLYDTNPEIFDQFEYPKIYEPGPDHTVTERNMTAEEKVDLIESILMDTEGLEVLYTDPEILQNRIGIYTRRRVGVWNDYSRGLGFRNTYNPTENVFEDNRTVRTIEVEGANANVESRNLATTNEENRDLTTADTEVRNLSNSNTETRDLTTAGSEVKGYNEQNSEVAGATEGRTKSVDLSDVTDETTAKATGSKTSRDLTDSTTENESNTEATVHDLSNMRDVTVEDRQNASSDIRTLNTADNTEERKGIFSKDELSFTNRQDKTDVKNNQSQSVKNYNGSQKETVNSEAVINSVDGYAGTNAGNNVSVTQSATDGHGSASNVSLPIDNAQTRTNKTSEKYNNPRTNYDETETSYTRSGSEGDVTTTDKLGIETTEHSFYGAPGDSDPKDTVDVKHTGTDATNKTDAGKTTTTTTHEGSEDTTVNGAKATVGNATHTGTEDVTGSETGTAKSATAHTGSEKEDLNSSSSKVYNRDGSDTTATSEAQTGSVSSEGTDTGSINRSSTEGGSVANRGTETGTVGNNGTHTENTSDTTDVKRHGNIGVTKSSELIADQLELVKKDLFTFVIQDFKHRFTLEVY